MPRKTTTTKLPKEKSTNLEIKLALVEQQIISLTYKIENMEKKVEDLCKLTNYGIGAWKSLLLIGGAIGFGLSVLKAIKSLGN